MFKARFQGELGGRERIRKTPVVVEPASNNLLQSSQNVEEIESNANLHTAEQKADNPLGIINTLPEGARGFFEASDQRSPYARATLLPVKLTLE